MIEFLFAASGKIASAIHGMSDAGPLSITTLALIALGGLIAGISPSGLAGAVAVLGQLLPVDRRIKDGHDLRIAASFSAGMVIALATLGVATVMVGRTVLSFGLAKWLPVLTLAMGLNMLGLVRWNWFRLRVGTDAEMAGSGSAFLLGIPFGLGGSPCTLPILITVLAIAAAKGSVLFGLVGLTAFSIGRSLPVLALGLVSNEVRTLPHVARTLPYVRYAAGGLITVVSIYFLTIGRTLLA